MNWMDRVYAFHFDDDKTLDDQIDSVAEFDLFSIENHRQGDLACHIKAALFEFMGEAALIRAFEQPGPQNGVNVHRGRDNRARNLIDPMRLKGEGGSSHSP